jgi:hypothetical protein
MPIKLKKTSSTSVVTGNSVLFNGTNQYLTLTGQNLSTGNFTIEAWVYLTATGTNGHIFNFGTNNNNRYVVFISAAGKFNLGAVVGGTYTLNDSTFTPSINTWYHVAYVRSGSTSYLYVNGTQVGTNSAAIDSGTSWGIGTQHFGAGASDYWKGYISNFRVVNGTAVYTSNFTPSTSPLTVIANTSLLTCQSATIIDNSTNNFTITNNNSATVSSAITPFSASLAYGGTNFKKNIYPRVGRSVQFNGSNQYLSGTGTLVSGATNFTAEAWIYLTSSPSGNAGGIIGTSQPANTPYGWIFRIRGQTQTPANKVSFQETWSANEFLSDTTLSTGTWYHLAAVRSGSVASIFINGTKQATTGTFNQSYTSTDFVIGRDFVNGNFSYFPGYISNLRIVSGTALYTASFTAPTSPLTAISGTSLLTCQSPTIIDNSSNNFTITNNNTAVVSTTNPFGADTTGGGMGMKKSAAIVYLTQKAIFGYGNNGLNYYSVTNLVSNTGVVATDTTGVGTARNGPAAASYGTDKAIFGYGQNSSSTNVSMTNLVSNTGVVSTDTTGVGTSRFLLAAAGYGTDKAIFGYGLAGASVSITNLVSNTGVVSGDTTGVGTARYGLAAAKYGTDKAIFGYGNGPVSMTNLVSNTGVVATDTSGVGTSKYALAAAGYGSDKAIFGYGLAGASTAATNIVSNTGVVATDTAGVGTARYVLAAAGYGADKAIFGYGQTSAALSMTNLVSNTGVVATDTTGVGTARNGLAAAGYSLT